jgi:hypothetical protein
VIDGSYLSLIRIDLMDPLSPRVLDLIRRRRLIRGLMYGVYALGKWLRYLIGMKVKIYLISASRAEWSEWGSMSYARCQVS